MDERRFKKRTVFLLAYLVFALLLYMTYSNLLSVSQAQVVQGRVSFALGWWPIHAVMIAIAILMYARQLGLLRARGRR